VIKPCEKTIRALELVAKGVPTQAICERLGISRNRLYQIKHYAEKPRQPAQQLNGEHLET
jgi:DNA invertase Pin-like site-specific DNA recombinase